MHRSRTARVGSACTLAAIAMLLAVLSVPMLVLAEAQPKHDAELRAGQQLDAIRGDPLALHVFLKRMPMGADLHNHLDGAVYAETYIRVGGEDCLCEDPAAMGFTK
jgi:adenosine deaminase